MSRYSSNSHRRHRDEPSSSERRPYGFMYPDLNDDKHGYEDQDDDSYRNESYYDDEDNGYPKRNSYQDDRDYRRRDRFEDNDDRYYRRHDNEDDYYHDDQPENGNFLSQLFWFVYTLFTSPLTILAKAGLWLISTILMFTPLYPFYLLLKKGTNVFGWIGAFIGFCKDLLLIAYNSFADVSNNRGYMTNKLPGDIRQAFSKLVGSQADDEYDDEHVRGKGFKKRAFDAGMYAATGGNYPKNLSGQGVSPKGRYGARGSDGENKSSIFAMLLSLGGMIYYVLTGQFLYNNDNGDAQHQYATPRQRRRYEEQKKKSYMRGIIGFVVIVLVLWWLFASGHLESGIRAVAGKVLSFAASLTFWIIKKLFYLLFWIPSLFFSSNNSQGRYDTPTPTTDNTDFGQYVPNLPGYLSNLTSGTWKYVAENLFNNLNATTLSELTNASPSEIGDILYNQFTKSLRWSASKVISGCFHANVCH